LIEFDLAETAVGGLDSVSTSASVSSVTENDSNGDNDQASASTSVVSPFNITVTPLTTQPVKGMGIFTHEVQVTNDNPVAVSGVRFYVASLPADGLVLNAEDVALFGDPAAPLDYFLVNGTLAAGESSVLTVKILRTGNQSPFTPVYATGLIKAPEVAVRVEADSPYPFKLGKGHFQHTLTVTNLSDVPVPAFRLFVGNLPNNVTLQGQSGSDDYGIPATNLPFILMTGGLLAGESQTIEILYTRTNNDNHFVPVYRARVAAAPAAARNALKAGNAISSASEPKVGTAMTSFPRSGNLLEWEVTTGKSYQVEYSDDLNTWVSAPEIITAKENRLQWFDDGQVTTVNPTESWTRYYRLQKVEAPASE
jgi:hypothetical protein